MTWKITGTGVENDPYYGNVSLLLKGDGTNGSTTIVDSSYDPKTITVNGDAQISTAQSKFGGSSLKFDGNGDYLSIPDDDSLELGTSDFTIEGFVYVVSDGIMFSKDTNIGVNYGNLQVTCSSSGNINFYCNPNSGNSTGLVLLSSTSSGLNTWTHFATTRSGNSWYLFYNGVLEDTATSSVGFRTSTAPLYVGCRLTSNSPSDFFNGYIDDLRITKGVARYTSNFTPPGPLPTF